MATISVLGGGWLGYPLALRLLTLGYQVNLSKTSLSAHDKLAAEKLKLFECQVMADGIQGDISSFFKSDILIVTFPPGFKKQQGATYLDKWTHIIKQANEQGIKKIIMTSSTGVYPDEIEIAKESDACDFSDKSGILLSVEQLLKTQFNGDYLILRLAGLFNQTRHPGNFVKRMRTLSSKAAANMLHLDDAIGAILYLIEQNAANQTFNLSSPEYVSKYEFYQAAVNKLKPKPEDADFPVINQNPGKQIDSAKIINFGYRFIYPNAKNAL